ncbi:LysR family transcriptional regulator [Vibrio sp. OCN044]|uniref:LysR family transcriptional regulator n=1 Tax=Vibrio tetraodonis subsp. pristinus TaxID=2695891 RepID=A0A6L8LX96_9VIBR|nr:LysR family transcriptional regulator [Vibrio tetraodonis]MYM60113.1 LysR family transcriptional regulator [Vibrio tetraodonis subsp. pristinus]
MIQYTLDQMLSFALTAEHGSFAKAARASGKDRTTISEHVNNLEIALNAILFERGNNKLVITEQGKALLRWSRGLIRHAEALQSFADSLSFPEQHHFKIAVDMHLPSEFILDVDIAARKSCPNITIDWIYRSRDEAVEELKSKTLDAAIILRNDQSSKLIPPSGLMACYLGEVKGRLYTAVDSPLQEFSPVNFRDLADSTRYVLQSTSDAGLGERAAFSGRQVVLNGIELVVKFIEKDGWAYLPSIPMLDNNPKVKVLDANFLNAHWSVGHVLMSRSDISGEMYQLLLDSIKDVYKESF